MQKIELSLTGAQAASLAIAIQQYLQNGRAHGFKIEECPAGSCYGQNYAILKMIRVEQEKKPNC